MPQRRLILFGSVVVFVILSFADTLASDGLVTSGSAKELLSISLP